MILMWIEGIYLGESCLILVIKTGGIFRRTAFGCYISDITIKLMSEAYQLEKLF